MTLQDVINMCELLKKDHGANAETNVTMIMKPSPRNNGRTEFIVSTDTTNVNRGVDVVPSIFNM